MTDVIDQPGAVGAGVLPTPGGLLRFDPRVAPPTVGGGTRSARPEARSHVRLRARWRRVVTSRTACVIGIGTVALLARLVGLPTAYDVFIDEVSYTNISISVAHGHGVTLYGRPFALHPPAAFGLYALVIRLLGLHGTTEQVLFALRHVDVVLGTAICIVTFLLVEQASRRRVAVVAALLMAVDPLAISFDSRVMLEAPAQLAVVSMFYLLVRADGAPEGTAARRNWLVLAGLAGGVVLCTKETFGLVVVGALGCLWATGWVIARREVVRVGVVAAACYLVSVISLALSSGFGVWWANTLGGALRLVGADQTSGFNAPQTKASFLSRVLANGSVFAVVYVILAVGTVLALALLWRFDPWNRPRHRRDHRGRSTVLVAVWTMSAAAYLVYATLFGTIEEQMYYILLLPCAISVCLWFGGRMSTGHRRWRVIGILALTVALVVDGSAWSAIHTGRDDEYRRLLSWEAVHVAPTAVVAATDGTSQFLLQRGIIGHWATLPQLKSHHVDYVIIATLLVSQGYGLATPTFARAVERGGRLVFEADGVSDGSLRVYDVSAMTAAVR